MALESRREFALKQKYWSIRDKNMIFDAEGTEIGYFIRKLFALRATYFIKDASDATALVIQQKIRSWNPAFKFYRSASKEDKEAVNEEEYLGILKKKVWSVRQRYWFENMDGERLFDIVGNIWALQFQVMKGDKTITMISRKLWAIADNYGVQIDPDVPDAEALLILGSIVVLHYIRLAASQSSSG